MDTFLIKKNIRDAETLLIETDYSKKFEGQQISISKSVRTVNKSNFGFSINNLDYEHLMYRTPERIIRFKDKDILLEAQKILKYFPAAKINHLEDIIKNGFTNRR
jgi:hypothetical protein